MNEWTAGEHHLRLSDAEREQASAELGEHFAQGRLTREEYGERLDRIWAARTRGELPPIFRDLPSRTTPTPARRGAGTPGRRFPRLPAPLLVLVVALVALTVVTHLPLILVGLGVWFLLSHRGSCAPRPRGHHYR